MKFFLLTTLVISTTLLGFSQDAKTENKPDDESEKAAEAVTVVIATSKGEIQVKLDAENAPKTVANFLKYVDADFYDGTIFHRVIANFMIQGGGFKVEDEKLQKQKTNPPVVNESAGTPSNKRGTIAMARTNDPDSATAQFFINVTDNPFLDHPNNNGYTTFGKVTGGMDVVDQIRKVKTGIKNGMRDVPEEPVVIKSIKRAQ